MYEFVAIGPGAKQHWHRPIQPDQVIQLGRAPKQGWAVPWDMRISRAHAELTLKQGRLHVLRLPGARNSIYRKDEPVDEFSVGPGEEFRIGKTIFHLAMKTYSPSGEPAVHPGASPDASLNRIARQPEVQRLSAILARLDDEDTSAESHPAVASLGSRPANTPSEHRESELEWSPPASRLAFGDFELGEQLHQTEFARVFKAWHRYMQRWAAIGVLSSAKASDELIARFRRKARLIGSFDHEGIVRAFDAGETEGAHFLVTEFVDGWTLDAAADRQRNDATVITSYLAQIARALAHAHERNVIHRDVKPAHVLVAREGRVKLIGWGKAWCNGDWSLSEYEGAGHIIGTPEFMSPEQLADSRDVDERSDVYSLGRTLFSLLAAVFGGATVSDQTKVGSLTSLHDNLPNGLDDVYRRMVERERSRRFQSMNEVVDALESLT